MNTLPNLPLIQERFLHNIKPDLTENDIRYPEFEVINVFLQTWGSTALGFGGCGGQAMTSAYTTIIESVDLGYVGVFFCERLAYVVKHPNANFTEDLQKRRMCSVGMHHKYEKRE